ncbi:MAG TPA: hypothetical protein VLS89_02290, partial [Candidatus Nanopelagicales bacterium]|nr:hypothetical protein [Candidatus Nanopelagicales bacterium]
MPHPSGFFSSTRAAALAAVAAASLAPSRAAAVVEQIDGTVVPVLTPATCAGPTDKCLQTALNIGEGLPANTQNNPLNAIFDAAVSPEVFT